MTTRMNVDVLFVGHCPHEVAGMLELCDDLGLSSESLDAVSLDDSLKRHDPRLVVAGRLSPMLSARAVAAKRPGIVFVRRTSTSPGVWDVCGEAGELASWIKTCSMLDNCHIGAGDKRVHATLRTVPGTVLWPMLHDLPRLSPRCVSDGALRLACGGRSSETGASLPVALAVAALRRSHAVELHVWERDGSESPEWLELTGDSLRMHACSDGPGAFCESLRKEGVDVFLQPSISESFGLSAADALSAGVPVVGSESIEFLPESWLVRDPGSAAEVMERTLGLARLPRDDIHNAQLALTKFVAARRTEVETTLLGLLEGTGVPKTEEKVK